MFLVALWIAGRACVTFSAETGWLAAMLVDCSFLLLIAAAAAREIIAGRKWNNLSVVALILVLLAGNVAFHLEAHFNGAAEIGIRVGIAVVVLLISLIGGRIIPSFTRNWLVRENPGRLPVPFARFDMLSRRRRRHRAGVLDRFAGRHGTGYALARCRRAAPGPPRTLGRVPDRPRAAAADPSRRLRFRADRLPAERLQRLRHRAGRGRRPCLDGGSRRRHDAGGDEPGFARPYRPATDGVGRDPGNLRRDRRRRLGAHLRGPRTGPQRAAAACRGVRLGRGVPWIRPGYGPTLVGFDKHLAQRPVAA